jgi:tetratricopeptide (TPR) repeat protein
MSKRFFCLPILLCSLSYLHGQDNLTTTSPDNRFTNASFVALITNISQRANEQALTGKAPAITNYDYYFKEFAANHGVTSSQVKELVDQWVNADSVKAAMNDFMLQGARSYYLQQFSASSLYYEQAAELSEAEADTASYAYLLAGNSAGEGGDFKRAIQLYRKADHLLALPDSAQKKRHLKDLLAVVLFEEGSRTDDETSLALLAEAVTLERVALATYSSDRFPEEWARTQSNLGTVLQEQGDRTAGESGDSLLIASIGAYRAALTIYTKKDFPADWAGTQNNIGVVFSKMGAPEEAITAFKAALEVYIKKDFPQDWALTQYNLGTMLQLQASDAKDEKAANLFGQSASAYQLSLEVYTEKEAPEEWGWAQHNLGISLYEQARLMGKTALFTQSIAALRAALAVRDRECSPEEWASTQYNLGTALWEAAGHAGAEGMGLREQSAAAYKAALEFYNRTADPEQWFNIQNNLGLVYEQLQQWTYAIRCFDTLRDMDPAYAMKKVNELRRKAGQ